MTSMLSRILLALAAVMLAEATALGALASHALDGVLDAAALRSFSTAVDYQFVHAAGLLGLAVYGERHPEMQGLSVGGLVIFAGSVLFSGGVFASSLDGPGWISSLAPVGGIGLILGWLLVAGTVLRSLGKAVPGDG